MIAAHTLLQNRPAGVGATRARCSRRAAFCSSIDRATEIDGFRRPDARMVEYADDELRGPIRSCRPVSGCARADSKRPSAPDDGADGAPTERPCSSRRLARRLHGRQDTDRRGDSGCAAGFRARSNDQRSAVPPSSDGLDAARDAARCEGVIHVGGSDASCCEADTSEQVLDLSVASCRDAIAAAQVLGARADAAPRLWLITRGARTSTPALAQAPRDAIGSVIASEYPAVWGGAVDLDANAEPDHGRVLQAILHASAGAQLAIRSNRVLLPTIVRAVLPEQEGRLRFDRQSAYLITGGFGGMGLRIAEWMSGRGAGCLVLAGRRGATPESRTVIEAIERTGTVVVAEKVDVGEGASAACSPESAHRRSRSGASSTRPALRGPAARAARLGCRRVFLPKATGA